MVVDSFVVAVIVVGVGAGSADGGIRVDNVGGVERVAVAVAVAVGVVGVNGAGDDEAGVVVVVVAIAVAAEVTVGGEGGVGGVGGVVEVAAAAVIVVVATRCWGGTSEDRRGVGKVGMGHRVLRGKSALRCIDIFRAGKTDGRKIGGC